jgi:glucan-binding YG repeat protein
MKIIKKSLIAAVCVSLLLGSTAISSYAATPLPPPEHLYDIGLVKDAAWEKAGESWIAYSSGKRIYNSWVLWKGGYYLIDSDGIMNTGWRTVAATHNPNYKITYYFNKNGKMATGWNKLDGNWYFFQNTGQMVTKWLEFHEDDPLDDSATYYLLASNGRMLTGWQKYSENWYYLRPSGSMVESKWVKDKGVWYYMKSGGAMACSETLTIGGQSYSFSGSGKWIE